MRLLLDKNSLFRLVFILTLPLDAYCFITVGNRNITVFYLLIVCLFVFSLIDIGILVGGMKRNIFALLMIFYMPINFLLNGGKATTLLISEILWIFYVISYRRSTYNTYRKTIKVYQWTMNIMAVYGLYQFVAHSIGLPFADIIIPGHMSEGYNWGNDIRIAGFIFRRSNAVFREPSFFSQFLSINILIYVQKLFDEPGKKNQKVYGWIMLNVLAMLVSFSGTGIIMLAGGFIALIFFDGRKVICNYIRKHMPVIMLMTAGFVTMFLLPNPLRDYFFSRFGEFDSSNVESISAYIRFVKPYKATVEILSSHLLLGLGLGNTYNYVTSTIGDLHNSLSIALPRAFAELGIIGGFLYVLFMIKAVNKRNWKFGPYRAILVGTYLMTFMHGTWSSEIYWLFLALLNVKLMNDGEIR